MSYVEIKNIVKDYKKGKSCVSVLKGIDLSFERGDFLSIVGASGAGKSTLLHIMGGLDRPSGGLVLYDGSSVFGRSEEGLAAYRSKTVGFVFQFHHLLPEFSAEENAAMPALIAGLPKEEAMSKAVTVLSELGLKERLSHKPGELSGGEQQRVAIGRALINDPKILLADEPTGNLDSLTGEEIYEILMSEKKKRGMSLVMVTHNEELAGRAKMKVRLKDGLLKFE